MTKVIIEDFCPSNKEEWSNWLERHHLIKEAVWLIVYKKRSATPNLTWSESVDEALRFGWIDSLKKPIDDEKYRQYFSKRKANSIWSKTNKDKIEALLEKGLMSEAGLKTVEIAKKNGSWSILDAAETLEVPMDLASKFNEFPGARDFFDSQSKSCRKSLLTWIAMAKRPVTREKRVLEIAENAGQNLKPKAFR
ncbi:YdeI/OmpD-associated family protein [Cyclobacterium sp. 1_MG-2023]|uniref:YdeI/OmpD-associated family protein n=1 Tax=Cyclobacterium sp. 1_MG-2023 TaxID=3062681 RepID=UPI0026E1A64F|nr:YdeI/OmpD-associated family protein [Cyclobacterium sp. 1_MG-2023]MDO6436687.1 YdeI/OmpD-associated family protein [Cyclobacterium sp. 1_MG-2023]